MRYTGRFRLKLKKIGLLTLLWLSLFTTGRSDTAFSPEKISFSVKVKGEILPYKVMAIFILPQKELTFEVVGEETHNFKVITADGQITKLAAHRWRWHAPQEKGHYTVRIVKEESTDSMMINIFVMIPYSELKGEYLNNYNIGKYPTTPLKQLAIYKPPPGFIEVTQENEETFVSPHFRLKQFICKQDQGYPKYLVLKERLVLKLELILEKVNEKGYRCNTFAVMSGYRTPYYNRAIGNVKYSRHVWGGAADIYIDEKPVDGMMDDLNNDGQVDYRDAKIVYDIIDDMYGKSWYEKFIGGLGRYKKTVNHGPFVHVDVRGFHARWGK
jgi:hypothetical protein